MRRMVLVSTMKAATLHARVVLAAMSLAVLLVLAWALAAPAAAQQAGGVTQGGDDEAAARATGLLQDAAVTIQSDSNDTVDRIEIAAADCDVDKGATITIQDGDTVNQTFTNLGDSTAEGASTITATDDQVVVTDIEDDLNARFGVSSTGEVTDFVGITCGREAGGAAAANGNGNGEKGDDDLENLSCDKLLVLFRGGGQGQYGDADILTNRDARARIEVCLKKEIVQGTAADGDLPDTGGLSLLGLAVLGTVSAVAGLSVIRGGRR